MKRYISLLFFGIIFSFNCIGQKVVGLPVDTCDATIMAVEIKYDIIEVSEEGGVQNSSFHDKGTWLGGTGDTTGSTSLANDSSYYPFDIYAYEMQSQSQVVLSSFVTIASPDDYTQFMIDVGFIDNSGALVTAANWIIPTDASLSFNSIFPNSNSGYPPVFDLLESGSIQCVPIEEIKEKQCDGSETYRFVSEDGGGNLVPYELEGVLSNSCNKIDNVIECLDSIKNLLLPTKKYNPSSDIECWQYGSTVYIRGQEFSEESDPFDKIYVFTDDNGQVDTTGTMAIKCPDGTFVTTIECYVGLNNGALYNQYSEILITTTTNTATSTVVSDTTINGVTVNGNFGEDLTVITNFEDCASWVDPRADLTVINNSINLTNDILNLLLADAQLNDLSNGQDVCCDLSLATGPDISVTKRILYYENANVTVNYFDNLGVNVTATVLNRLAVDPEALDCCPSPEVSECLFCDDSFSPTPNTNTGRMYRRTVNATQWQVYSWQISRIRTYINSLGGTITSENIGFYSDSGFSNPLLASRISGGINPKSNTSGPLTDGQLFINYNAASYLNRTTETSVYFEQALTYEFDGCTYDIINRYEYTVPTSNQGWTWEGAEFECTEQ